MPVVLLVFFFIPVAMIVAIVWLLRRGKAADDESQAPFVRLLNGRVGSDRTVEGTYQGSIVTGRVVGAEATDARNPWRFELTMPAGSGPNDWSLKNDAGNWSVQSEHAPIAELLKGEGATTIAATVSPSAVTYRAGDGTLTTGWDAADAGWPDAGLAQRRLEALVSLAAIARRVNATAPGGTEQSASPPA
ncbi:MAG: hypothetical protein JOZ24_06280 [Candidatus Eremiobacteraeota bacterium]|nr:hypothetical protein [Candidatus Eremiobacteraeota bacterium]